MPLTLAQRSSKTNTGFVEDDIGTARRFRIDAGSRFGAAQHGLPGNLTVGGDLGAFLSKRPQSIGIALEETRSCPDLYVHTGSLLLCFLKAVRSAMVSGDFGFMLT